MELKDIIAANSAAFEGMDGIDTTVTALSAKLKEVGYNLVIDDAKNPTMIPKGRFDELIGQKNQFKSQAEEHAKELEALKKAAKGNDELTAQIQALQEKSAEWEKKHAETVMNGEAKLAAMKFNAHDAGDVLNFIDKSKLKYEDGVVKGLDEQIKALQESKSYLFKSVEQPKNPPLPNMGGSPQFQQKGVDNPWSKKTLNLTKQWEIMESNPALAEQLKASAEN